MAKQLKLIELIICDQLRQSNMNEMEDFTSDRIENAFSKMGKKMVLAARKMIEIETEYGFNSNYCD